MVTSEFIRSYEVIPAINQVESHVYFPQLELQREMADARGNNGIEGFGID
ncbi:hypothetical protein IAI10_15515 [Clostridium sp. 19966]|nr:hypothetical protein [Clostridium sp. 19966]MDT8718074.1 hypothetical protein [Clostridium sp. 19966]